MSVSLRWLELKRGTQLTLRTPLDVKYQHSEREFDQEGISMRIISPIYRGWVAFRIFIKRVWEVFRAIIIPLVALVKHLWDFFRGGLF